MKSLDSFTRQYIETALWSSTDENMEPLDKNFSIDDIDSATLETMIEDCKRFQIDYSDWLGENDSEKAGQDFWLTRNGHGAGFWAGEWPINGELLTKWSKMFGEFNLYVGDNGKLFGV